MTTGITFVDEGIIDGVQYVTVLDSGLNPLEFAVPLTDAEADYPGASIAPYPPEEG
jgi:hypothetical protein